MQENFDLYYQLQPLVESIANIVFYKKVRDFFSRSQYRPCKIKVVKYCVCLKLLCYTSCVVATTPQAKVLHTFATLNLSLLLECLIVCLLIFFNEVSHLLLATT